MSKRRARGWIVWLIPVGVAFAASLLYALQNDPGMGSEAPREARELAASTASGREVVGAVQVDTLPWAENFSTSLHATAQGMKTWYAESNHGFEEYTGVPYEQLPCKSCHEPSATGGCASCHGSARPRYGAEVDASLTGVCGDCHSRQKAEATHFSDVHRDMGMDCMMCHTKEDVMGDGATYSSMLEDGAIDTKCEDCHTTLAENPYHLIHQETVDCSACHVQSVVSCYNCHFETQIQLAQKVAYGQFKDFVFLVNRNGKVHAGNFQAVKHGDDTFVAMAPFYAHTIAKNVRECMDCHGNAAVRNYLDDGMINVATWDPTAGEMKYIEGVVPVPPDYQTALRFDFVDLDRPGGKVWSFLESGPDRIQMLFGESLTDSQMEKLGWTAFWRSSSPAPRR